MTAQSLSEPDLQTMPSSQQPILSAQDLSVTYLTRHEPVRAMADANISIMPKERVALVGESGSGKSTLGLALAGLLAGPLVEVTAKELTFAGKPLKDRGRSRLPVRTPGIAMVFQDAMTSLDTVWTIGSQLIAVLRATEKISRSQAKAEARDWLHRVGLTDTERVMHARPYELSGGMRQRAMMAIALCSKPSLLIADEPTSALDATLSRRTMELLLALTESSDAALLIITHDIALCQEFTQRTVVAYQGHIVDSGPSDTLAEYATHPYTKALLACVPTLENAELDELPTLDSVYASLATGAGAGLNPVGSELRISA